MLTCMNLKWYRAMSRVRKHFFQNGVLFYIIVMNQANTITFKKVHSRKIINAKNNWSDRSFMTKT